MVMPPPSQRRVSYAREELRPVSRPMSSNNVCSETYNESQESLFKTRLLHQTETIILRQLFGNDFVSLLKSLWNETAIHRLDYRLDYITWFRTLPELITLQLWTHSPALVEMVKLQTDSI